LRNLRAGRFVLRVWVLSMLWLLAAAGPAAGPPATGPAASAQLLAEAEAEFSLRTLPAARLAAGKWSAAADADPAGIAGLVGVARAQVWIAVHEREADERLAAARAAVEAGELCAERAADDPECSYWLGVALGVQARERRLTALGSLRRMVRLLDAAATRRPAIDHGGPHRVLALVFLRAPGWPLGPGNDKRGLEHARAAVAVEADFPPNQLALGEALVRNGAAATGREALQRAAALARARADQGDPDAVEWLAEAEEFLQRRREQR